MRKLGLMFLSLCFGVISVVLWANPALCLGRFPGDGYPNPDAFGVSGHGPALSYTDNGDGTFTDNNTKFMWEKKLAADGSDGGNCNASIQADRSVHCVNNTYTWTKTGTAADGTLFRGFLRKLKNRCAGDERTRCTSDADCVGIGNGLCGLAGHRDWCIPNIKKLQSIADYSTFNPASSVPGSTAVSLYWSATTRDAALPSFAWYVQFGNGDVALGGKGTGGFHARAVRSCP